MSDAFELRQAWSPYLEFMTIEEVSGYLSDPLRLSGEPIVELIPSISMTPGGLRISQLFMTTSHYLCEIQVSTRSRSWDYVNKENVSNIRWSFYTTTVGGGDQERSLDSATITLMHGFGGSSTDIHFIGTSRDAWVETVSRALPAGLLLRSAATRFV